MKYRSIMLAVIAALFVIILHFLGYTSLLQAPTEQSAYSQNQPNVKISVLQQGNKTVEIQNFKFDPAIVKIYVEDTVKFINIDEDPHTVTAKDGSFDSKGLDKDQTWTYTFTKTGTLPYFCAIHPFMKGTVTVMPKGDKNEA